ncbi:MAG: hypothetical protein EAZ55_06120 [Cytophagales bacterium]|nr:MAG: hypothetical protein EAZ55_06120 [Cytophagales bacterium]
MNEAQISLFDAPRAAPTSQEEGVWLCNSKEYSRKRVVFKHIFEMPKVKNKSVFTAYEANTLKKNIESWHQKQLQKKTSNTTTPTLSLFKPTKKQTQKATTPPPILQHLFLNPYIEGYAYWENKPQFFSPFNPLSDDEQTNNIIYLSLHSENIGVWAHQHLILQQKESDLLQMIPLDVYTLKGDKKDNITDESLLYIEQHYQSKALEIEALWKEHFRIILDYSLLEECSISEAFLSDLREYVSLVEENQAIFWQTWLYPAQEKKINEIIDEINEKTHELQLTFEKLRQKFEKIVNRFERLGVKSCNIYESYTILKQYITNVHHSFHHLHRSLDISNLDDISLIFQNANNINKGSIFYYLFALLHQKPAIFFMNNPIPLQNDFAKQALEGERLFCLLSQWQNATPYPLKIENTTPSAEENNTPNNIYAFEWQPETQKITLHTHLHLKDIPLKILQYNIGSKNWLIWALEALAHRQNKYPQPDATLITQIQKIVAVGAQYSDWRKKHTQK